VRFEVIMTVKVQVKVFWAVTPRSVVVGYQCFRGPGFALKVDAGQSFKTLASYCSITWCHCPEDIDLKILE
jgi:hypothetical protein